MQKMVAGLSIKPFGKSSFGSEIKSVKLSDEDNNIVSDQDYK
jgi:hypothetical protein